MCSTDSKRRFSPAAQRNTGPILEVLRQVLPSQGLILEVVSGSGQHVSAFAQGIPGLTWQPTEYDSGHFPSIEAWSADVEGDRVRPPMALDVHQGSWPVGPVDGIICINMVHITPWTATVALFEGACRHLSDGPLVLYGPFGFHGRFTAESNAQFHLSLRARDPRWGVRDVDDLEALATANRLQLNGVHGLPANNHCLVFQAANHA